MLENSYITEFVELDKMSDEELMRGKVVPPTPVDFDE